MTPTVPKTKAPFVHANDVNNIFAVYILIIPPFIALMIFNFFSHVFIVKELWPHKLSSG
jgi:hypothetical protein